MEPYHGAIESHRAHTIAPSGGRPLQLATDPGLSERCLERREIDPCTAPDAAGKRSRERRKLEAFDAESLADRPQDLRVRCFEHDQLPRLSSALLLVPFTFRGAHATEESCHR